MIKLVADTPLNLTSVMPVKLLPVMVTGVPTGPLVGVNDEMLGTNVTTKLLALLATPARLITLTRPEVAPAGTFVRNCVAESIVKLAETPLNVTELTLLKLVPVTVTGVPTSPVVGLNEVKVGG